MTDVATLVYELAMRSLEQQERQLAELRARTSTVIATAAVTASFLGSAAIRQSGGLSPWSIVALAVLVVTAVLTLVVLWPNRRVSFALDARAAYARLYHLADRGDDAQLRVAFAARDRQTLNKRTVDRLEIAFQAAVVTLALQTILWALALVVA